MALGGGLFAVGMGQVRGSTAGRYVDPTLGPDEPGYAAFVTPTPTLLVLMRSADGQLGGVALLSLQSGDSGGSVIVMPAATQALADGVPTTFAQTFAESGVEGVVGLVELSIDVAVHETVEIDDQRWVALVDPVGTVEVELDSPVASWPEGPVTLTPVDVGPFLSARAEGEPELNRVERQRAFWQAWLTALATSDASELPGESDSGLGRFLRGLAAGLDDVSPLPVAPIAGLPDEQFAVDEAMTSELVARSIPYPQSPVPGARVRIRLLNGTHDPDLTVRAAEQLVEAGAEITISGNAASFDEPTTRLVYSDPAMRDMGTWFQQILGIGVVEENLVGDDAAPVDESEEIDITVILGADAPEAIRR